MAESVCWPAFFFDEELGFGRLAGIEVGGRLCLGYVLPAWVPVGSAEIGPVLVPNS
jgi:hypothetical protein